MRLDDLHYGKEPVGKSGERSGTIAEGNDLQLVTFTVGSEVFAVDILVVQEINRMMRITEVPQSPSWVEGVVNLRGQIIPVVDLRRRLGLPRAEYGPASRIVVVEANTRTIGFIVDRVNEVVRISHSCVDAAPGVVAPVVSQYIAGIAKLKDRLLILLDLDKLLSGDELRDSDRAQVTESEERTS